MGAGQATVHVSPASSRSSSCAAEPASDAQLEDLLLAGDTWTVA